MPIPATRVPTRHFTTVSTRPPRRTCPFALLLAVALPTLAAAPALADWVRVSASEQSVYYLHSGISRKVGDNVMVWVLRDHKARQFATYGAYLSSKDQIEIDCRGWRVRRAYSSDHTQPMGAGAMLHYEYGPMSWNDAQPGTILGRVVAIACAHG